MMEDLTVEPIVDPNGRICMFCGTALTNRGEAYYDHLQQNAACTAAWKEWTERLDEDRPSGG